MKKIKLRYKILIVGLVVVLLIPPFNYFVMRDSVMEDIYRKVNKNYYNINKFEGICTFKDEEIEGQLWFSDDSYFYTFFHDDYLDEKFEVYLTFPSKTKKNDLDIRIKGIYKISESLNLHMIMNYNHKKRTMTYESIFLVDTECNTEELFSSYYNEPTITQYLNQYGITQEDIKDYQHYILYDVVYQSWVSGTDNGRKLNKWDYRNIKEVDNTFNFEVVE